MGKKKLVRAKGKGAEGDKGGKKPKESAQEKKAKKQQIEALYNEGVDIQAQANSSTNPSDQWTLYQQACAKYEEACTISTDLDCLNNWGNCLFSAAKISVVLGKPPQQHESLLKASITKHEEAIAFDTSNRGATLPFIHNNLGNTYVYLAEQSVTAGDVAAAERHYSTAGERYESALAINPTDPDVLINKLAAVRAILELISQHGGNADLARVRSLHTTAQETLDKIITGPEATDGTTDFDALCEGIRAALAAASILRDVQQSHELESELASVLTQARARSHGACELVIGELPGFATAHALSGDIASVAAEVSAGVASGPSDETLVLHQTARQEYATGLGVAGASEPDMTKTYASAGDNELEFYRTLTKAPASDSVRTQQAEALRNAVTAYEQVLSRDNTDYTSRYNLACVLALLVPLDPSLEAACGEHLTVVCDYAVKLGGKEDAAGFGLTRQELVSDQDLQPVSSSAWFQALAGRLPQ